MERILTGIAAAILVGQLAWIGEAHQVGSIYGNWAMYHTGVNYEATATVDGVTLSPDEFQARYRIPSAGFNGRSLDHVTAILQGREAAYNDGQAVMLSVRYSENGGEAFDWRWSAGVVRVAAAQP